MIQDAVIRNFEIIGEASKNVERVAPEFVDAHPELPLAFAYDMRNLLAHGYYKVDVNVVWKTIERDLPYLQEQVTQVMLDLWNCLFAKFQSIYSESWKMNPKDIRTSSDPDLAGSYAAMERAARAAQDLAIKTNTGIVVAVDGKTVELTAADLIKMRDQEARQSQHWDNTNPTH